MGRHAQGAGRSRRAPWLLGAAVLIVAAGTVWVIGHHGQLRGQAVSADPGGTVAAASSAPGSATQASTYRSSRVSSSAPTTGPVPATGSTSASLSATSSSSGSSSSSSPMTSSSITSASTTAAPAPCPSAGSLRVAAPPGFLPVLAQVASSACVSLTLTPAVAADGAELLATGKVDAWIPDSREYASAAGTTVAAQAPSVAWSPVVMAATGTTARSVSSPTWASLITGHGRVGTLPVTIESLDSGVSLSLAGKLTGLATAASDNDPYLGLAGAAGAITRIPAVAANQPIANGQIRITEQRLVTKASVLDTAEGVPVLDLPWIAGRQQTAAQKKASTAVLTALQGAPGRAARARYGYANPGQATVSLGGRVTAKPLAAVDMSQVSSLFAMTGKGLRPGNALAVLDISGSMGDPSSDGSTPMDGVKQSAPLLITGLSAGTKVGLWEFGNALDPPDDWYSLVDLAPLSQNRSDILTHVAAIEPQPTGTSLNATVLAAYKYLQAHYDSKATNLVGIFTDGRNEDAPDGIDLAGLEADLKSLADPRKPINLLFFGYGHADIDAMKDIVKANGGHGGVWRISEPAQIVGAMLQATGTTSTFE